MIDTYTVLVVAGLRSGYGFSYGRLDGFVGTSGGM